MASQAFSVHLSPSSNHLSDIIPISIPMSLISDKPTSNSLPKKKKATSSSSSSSAVPSSIDGEKLTNTVSALMSSLGFVTPSTSSGNFCVAADWKETPASHVIKVEVPGLKKEQVKVEMEDEGGHVVLVISGDKEMETLKEGEKWIFAETRSGTFCRRFKLSENTKVEEIKAIMEDGVLTVTVPKVEAPKKIAKSIQISAA